MAIDIPRIEKIGRNRFQTEKDCANIQESVGWRCWRDACVAYFARVSGLPLPPGAAAPAHPLEYYKALRFPYAPRHR